MLREHELLYYLFFTGRGEEFTKIYADTTFLKRLEDGTFKEDDILKRIPTVRPGKSEASSLLKNLFTEDLLRIKSLSEEKSIKEVNILVK